MFTRTNNILKSEIMCRDEKSPVCGRSVALWESYTIRG